MCGRFSLSTEPTRLAEVFGLDLAPPAQPRFNIAPTQGVLAVRHDDAGRRVLRTLRWGLIPSWADDPAIGSRLINARSETVAQKPAFRQALRQRRCLLPADAFYEWRKLGTRGKQPYAIRMLDDRLFALAGLWELWRDPAGQTVESCAVLTTQANALVAPIHDRMPVILPPASWDAWLDVRRHDPAGVAALLGPYPAQAMRAYPVSPLINSPQRDDPRCLEPAPQAPPTDAQGHLF